MTAVRSIDFAAGRRAVAARPQRAAAAQAVAASIFKVEDSLDAACGDLSSLVATMVKARRDADLSKSFGQDLFDEAADAQSHVVAAMNRIAALHNKSVAISSQLGLRPSLDFGTGDKGQEGFVGGA